MQYATPATVDEAVALLAKANGGGRVLAGGTDLLVQIRAGMVSPELVVDIKSIPETRKISIEDGGIRIGAAVSGAELGENEAAVKAWPGVVEAVELIGSTQVQGRASAGGNLCNGSPAADSVPALIAARAVCTVAGPGGTRQVPVEDIVTGPGKTSIKSDEFLVDIFLPTPKARSGDAYLRMIPRTEMDIAIVGAGVSLSLDEDGTCNAARVVLGAVAPTAVLVPDAAAAIIGTKLEDDALEKLAAAASAACNPIDDKRGTITYRVKVAGVLARRAALIARDRAS